MIVVFGLEGNIRTLAVAKDATKKPPSGKAWLLLCGSINHVTGTDTLLKAVRSDGKVFWSSMVAAADGSALYPIFGHAAISASSAFQYVVVEESEWFTVTGDTGALARMKVLEFTP